jgi:predicted XRE-type DNA-binding protein
MPRKANTPEDVWKFVDKKGEDECWLWTSCIRNNYGNFSVKNKTLRPHRIIYELTYDKIPDGMFVCHKCDIPLCCNPKHLFLGTHTDNMQDMVKKGRLPSQIGEKSHTAKLSEESVRKIRELHKTGNYYQRQIAAMFKISRQRVSAIITGKCWEHVI